MFITIILISISLAMDAFSVSVSCGCSNVIKKQNLHLALSFGIFQAIMPALGWFLGDILGNIIKTYSPWIAFVLLFSIGCKMLYESFQKDEYNPHGNTLSIKTIFGLSIATSIDAFAIGITLPILKLPILLSCFSIGIITFILSYIGIKLGRKIGNKTGNYAEILGGFVLIILGLNAII
ncbi:MAG: hypothetical protein A2Y40_03405 [Candidatus Margulisbacteria bacterium GWF2_35_9]|nr:MAG: hypothetical protein A2Y40_03405 [Candidatus Margulisbacteria bacterium GWF2_35_9]